MVPGFDLQKLPTKSAQDRSETLHFKMVKNWRGRGRSTFGRWSWQNNHRTVARAGFHIKSVLKSHSRSRAESSPLCERCENVGGFGVTFLLCGFATGCDKTHWHGRAGKASVMLRRSWQAGLQLEVAKRITTAARQAVLDHSATLVLCRIAAGGC